jgi:hypothetical protein
MRYFLSLSFSILVVSFYAQEDVNKDVVVTQPHSFSISKPLVELGSPVVNHREASDLRIKKKRRRKYTNDEALPIGEDPLWQKENGTHRQRSTNVNFDGVGSGQWLPPDPSGAIGPDHYVQMTNSGYQVFDRDGNSIFGPVSITDLWPGSEDEGDPIVMYDKYADRWFLTQFQGSPNGILIAVSTTPDPLGTYYTYEYLWNNFPDYPKYSIWHDGYYMTANVNNQDVAVFERDQILIGNPTAQLIQLSLPNISYDDYIGPLPADADGELPESDIPMSIFYFEDDGWNGVSNDIIKIWEMDVNWETPNSSSVYESQTIDVSPFDTQFNSNWNDIVQPDVNQKLDAMPGAFMYRAAYRTWTGYSSILLNHTVDVNSNNQGGIRWYELRQSGDDWFLYQEGTYAPDDQSRFFGSLAMDYQGNIALAYSVSGSEVYPSLRYTGRMASDPLGMMTIAEDVIIDGLSSQTGSNRYGDYSQMTVDPLDDATFWFTGEYMGNNGDWKTRIASFKLANDFQYNISPTNLLSPSDGVLSDNETVLIEISNLGLSSVSNFTVEYRIDDGEWNTEQFTGTIDPGLTETYSFVQTADLSVQGDHLIELHTDFIDDMYDYDDDYSQNIYHPYNNDVGVSNISSPSSGMGLTENEPVIIFISNYGSDVMSNFTVNYSVNGNDPVEELFDGTINLGETVEFQFENAEDLSIPGNYNMTASTSLSSDQNLSNNSYSKIIEHTECLPNADCTYGDGFLYVELNTIANNSGCGNNGYSDFTDISTMLNVGETYELTVESDYDEQLMSVWIDYNDNMFFEEDEILVNDLFFDWETSTAITIPSDVPTGSHLLRLKACWDESSSQVCEDCDYGETEDYTVNLVANSEISPIEIQELEVKVEGNSILVDLFNLNEDVHLLLYNSLGQILHCENLLSRNEIRISIPMKHYAKGVYTIVLKNEETNLSYRFVY